MLLDKEQYLSSGVNIGMRRRVKDMEPYIYRVKKNKLAIINLETTDQKIEEAAAFLADYDPEDILVISRKEAGHTPVVQFADRIGADRIYGRFLPGTLTNPEMQEYREPEVVVVTDPEEDKQAVIEATQSNIPVVAICDTANKLDNIDVVIPANNKAAKSLATIYYLLTQQYLVERGDLSGADDFDAEINEFAEVDDDE